MPKILLVNPAQVYFAKTNRDSRQGSIGLPLGLLYVAAAFEAVGWEVRLFDSLMADTTTLTKDGPRTRFGSNSDELRRAVLGFGPDIVGISSPFTTQEESVVEAARTIKDAQASVLVVVGGANARPRAEQLLACPSVDLVVLGEGEGAAAALAAYWRDERPLAEIPSIAYRQAGAVRRTAGPRENPALDALPLPAYHLVDMERYLSLHERGIYARDHDVRRAVPVITSRGCPHRCIFCSIHQSMGRTWRAHSAEHLRRHIRLLAERYGAAHIHFEDDNLLVDIERFLQVLDVLAEKHLSWDTPNGIRVDLRISEEVLRRFQSAGCRSLNIGVESGDQEVLDKIVRKGINLGDVEEFARRCWKVGLPLRAFFILGFPGETIETMTRTADFALSLADRYDVGIINLIATPLSGTALFDVCQDNGYFAEPITPRALSESVISDGYGLIDTPQFSHRDVECLSRRLTAQAQRRQILKRGLRHPIRSLRRMGNAYTLMRTLKKAFLDCGFPAL